MASFIPIVAFCALMSSGDIAPVAPYECVWVEDQKTMFTTETGCSFRTRDLAKSESVIQYALQTLYNETGYAGRPGGFLSA